MPAASGLDRRRALLTAALGFALLDTQGRPEPPEQTLVKQWLDNWTGLGHVVTGMQRQGYRLHLTNVEASSWRATFDRSAMLAHDGFGADRTPWRAVQVAAWEALTRIDVEGSPAEPPGYAARFAAVAGGEKSRHEPERGDSEHRWCCG